MSAQPTHALPDAVLPPDAEAIMADALRAEGASDVKGVRPTTTEELRFQRRMALIFTVGPLAGVALAMVSLWNRGISPVDFWIFLGFYAFTGLGVTVGYHRLFTHRSFEVPTWLRGVIAIAGSLSIQGSIIDWVSTHRRHHAYADAYGDPHSPHLVQEPGLRGVLRGLWHAHMGWMFEPNGTVHERWAPDLVAEPMIARIDKAFPKLIVVSFALPAVIGFALTGSLWGALSAFVWGSLVRVFLLHHVTWSINSICHFFGERPFDSKDESTNNWPMSLLSFGESWHNNHHAFPTSARHGLLRGQFDISWRVIRTLQQLRLADKVRLPSPELLAKKWIVEPKRLAR